MHITLSTTTAARCGAASQAQQRQRSGRQAPRPLFSRLLTQPQRQRGLPVLAAVDDDIDVTVFRFTLGIPGFDDALIPRVVGFVGAALLVLNHVLTEGPASDAQARTEALCAVLSAMCIAAPTLEQRIKELDPGRGRKPLPESLEGAASCFAIRSDLPDSVKQELAWASYALMKNANICGLLVVWRGQALLCRGLLGSPVSAGGSKGDTALQAISQAWAPAAEAAAASSSSSDDGAESGTYWPERGALRGAGAAGWAFVPEGVQGLLLQPLLPLPGSSSSSSSRKTSASAGSKPEGALVLLCDRPRALSKKERAWAAAVADKLHLALSEPL